MKPLPDQGAVENHRLSPRHSVPGSFPDHSDDGSDPEVSPIVESVDAPQLTPSTAEPTEDRSIDGECTRFDILDLDHIPNGLEDMPEPISDEEQQPTLSTLEFWEGDISDSVVKEDKLYTAQDLPALYWGSTKDITEAALVSLVETRVESLEGEAQTEYWTLKTRQHGVYNSVYILESSGGRKVCVRVPAAGSSQRWNQLDSEALRATARAMRGLKEKTTVPIPRVLHYDFSLDTKIAAPYVLMDCVSGVGARQVWNAEDGTVPKETRRQNILRSLAHAIAGLRVLEYPTCGSLWFREDSYLNPLVQESWNLRVEGYVIKREFEVVKTHNSTRSKVAADLQALLDVVVYPEDYRYHLTKGVFELYQVIVDAFLKAAEVPEVDEKFAVMHTDFDIQNLMVDEHGNLTGILDWDGVCTQPKQAAWSMVPFWLQNDWSPGYAWPPAIGADYAMVKPKEYDRYRQDYARYLWDACEGVGDCRYTSKSHIYRAFFLSLSDQYSARRFVENVLYDILPRVNASVYCSQLGEYGFRAGEREWLDNELHEFFTPEPPKPITRRETERFLP